MARTFGQGDGVVAVDALVDDVAFGFVAAVGDAERGGARGHRAHLLDRVVLVPGARALRAVRARAARSRRNRALAVACRAAARAGVGPGSGADLELDLVYRVRLQLDQAAAILVVARIPPQLVAFAPGALPLLA